jgi:hypothetical protein
VRRLRDIPAARFVDHEAALWGRREAGTDFGGIFALRSKSTGRELHVIAATGEGWDHVSVSAQHSTPTWEEMEQVKRLFFYPDEVAFQLHVAVDKHLNHNPNVLHMWRPLDRPVPLPPLSMV